MNLTEFSHFLEAGMLVCFGFSWPFSILKSLRTKVVKGKSPVFLSLILIGYLFGIGKTLASYAAQRAAAAPGEPVALPWLLWFYLGLLVVVSVDAILYIRYRKNG